MDYRPKIKLSQDEFRVLASSTRIDILKLLDESQYTVSDISRKLDMNKATVHEHLTKLMEVGLVKKDDSPRKWVYYRLTWKGRNLLHPERVRVMVSLGVMLTVIVIGALIIAAQTDYITPGPGNGGPEPMMETGVHLRWSDSGQEDVYDIRLVTGVDVTIASVTGIQTYIEEGPTTITKRTPVDLRFTREGDLIHLYDYDGLLDAHEGNYLYLEGKLLDDQGVERSFRLRRYIMPRGLEVDLGLSARGIEMDLSNLTTTGHVTITFEVENRGTLEANSTTVQVFSVRSSYLKTGFPEYGSPYLKSLLNTTEDVPSNDSVEMSLDLKATDLYMRGVVVFIDPDNSMPEATEDNKVEMELPQVVKEFNERSDGMEEPPAREAEGGADDRTVVVAVVAIIIGVGIVLAAWVVMSRE